MDEKADLNEKMVKNLELLNKQVSELLTIEKKALSGYDYINAIELAKMLGESIKTVYARVHQKQIPYYKPGGKLLFFKLDEIKEWIKQGRHSTIDEIKERI